MKKIVFLSISEHRDPMNFLVPMECPIQLPVNEKTKSGAVYDQLLAVVKEVDPDGYLAHARFMRLLGDFDPDKSFFDHTFYVPEPGVKVYALFNLKTVGNEEA